MPSRRERAIERAYDRDPINRESLDPLPWDELLLECYEAELAADLESDALMDQLIQEHWPIVPLTNIEIMQSRDQMRAAFKAALEER